MSQPTLTSLPASSGTADGAVALMLSPADHARIERNARRWWVSAIVGLLGLQVFIGIGSIMLAVGDPTVAIVPNYHQKALDWDSSQRAAHLTEKLGWSVSPLVSLASPETGKRLVRVSILDGNQRPVTDLKVTASVYHHARGAEIYELNLNETDAGYYEGMTSLTNAGIWQLQLQIEGEHGVASDTREMIVE